MIKHDPDRGGFVFVEKCIELAGDYPVGWEETTVKFRRTGERSVARYSQTARFVPLAYRSGVQYNGQILPKGTNVKLGGDYLTKINVLALFEGASGNHFVAKLTMSSTASGKLKAALAEHKRRTIAMLRQQHSGRMSKSLANAISGLWRMCWIELRAGDPKMEGSDKAKSMTTPIEITDTPPVYMGPELKQIWFNADELREFEHAWDSGSVDSDSGNGLEPDDASAMAANMTPPEPDFPEDF